MEKLNLPPFYIGQKVVALKSGIHYSFKMGDTFVVKGLKQNTCGCWLVNIGLPVYEMGRYTPNIICGIHGRKTTHDGIGYIGARYLAPITESFQSISLEKVLEEETKLIGVN